jgi:hypothetical protein
VSPPHVAVCSDPSHSRPHAPYIPFRTMPARSPAKIQARLDREVTAGWVSPSSRVLWGGDAAGKRNQNLKPEPRTMATYHALRLEVTGGIAALAAALRVNTTLTILDLTNNMLGPKGAEILANSLVGNSTLEMLSLAENQICNMNEQVCAWLCDACGGFAPTRCALTPGFGDGRLAR